MRRIIVVVFCLELITILECRSLLHKCSTSVGDFTIFVCTNRTEIHCSSRRISIPINALTLQERKCIENAGHLGQNSMTCTHWQKCHSVKRVAHYMSTCAMLAVREITPMLPEFTTLSSRIQQSLIHLYIAVQKEVFKSLLTPIKTGSLHLVSVNLRLTQWCREFRFKCRNIAAILDTGCEHLGNRKRRDLESTGPSRQTPKQTNSTSFTGSAQELSTSLTSSRTQMTGRTVLQRTTLSSSSVARYRDIIPTMPSMPGTLSNSPPFINTLENLKKWESSVATYYVKSVRTTPSIQGVSLMLSMQFSSKNIHQTMPSILRTSSTRNTRTTSIKIEQSVTPTLHLPGTSPLSIPPTSSRKFLKTRQSTSSVTFSEGSKSDYVTSTSHLPGTSPVSIPPTSSQNFLKERQSTSTVTFSEGSNSIVVTSTSHLPRTSPMSTTAPSLKEYAKERSSILSVTFSETSKSIIVTSPVSTLVSFSNEYVKTRPLTLSVAFPRPVDSKLTVVTSTQALQQNLISPRASIAMKQSECHSLRTSSWQLPKASFKLSSLASSSLTSSQAPTSSLRPTPSLSMSSLPPLTPSSVSSLPLSSQPILTNLPSDTHPISRWTSTISLNDLKPTFDSSFWSGSHSSIMKRISSSIVQSIIRSKTYQSVGAKESIIDGLTIKALPPSSSNEPSLIVQTVLGSIEKRRKSTQSTQRTLWIMSSSLKDASTGSMMLTTSHLDKTMLPMSTFNIRSSALLGSSLSLSPISTSSSQLSSTLPSSFSKLSTSFMVPSSITMPIPLQSLNESLSSPTSMSSLVTSVSSLVTPLVTSMSSLVTPLVTSVSSAELPPSRSLSPSIISSVSMDKTVLSFIPPTSLSETIQQPLETNLKKLSTTIPQSLMPTPSVAPLNETSRTVTPLVKETLLSSPLTCKDTLSISTMVKSIRAPLSSNYPRNISLSTYTKPSETLHFRNKTALSIPSKHIMDTLIASSSTFKFSSSTLYKMTPSSLSLEAILSTITMDGSSATWVASPFSISANVSLASSVEKNAVSLSMISSVESLHSSSDALPSVKTEKSVVSSPNASYFYQPSVSHLLPSPSPSLPLSFWLSLSSPSLTTTSSLSLIPSISSSLSLSLLSSFLPIASFPSSNAPISSPLVSSPSSSLPLSSFQSSNVSILLSSSSWQPSLPLLSSLPPSQESLTLSSPSLLMSTSSLVPSQSLSSLVLPMQSSSTKSIVTSSPSLPSIVSAMQSFSTKLISTSWTTSSPIPSFLGTSSPLPLSTILSSKTITLSKLSSLPITTLSLQSLSTSIDSSRSSFSTTLKPSTSSTIPSSSLTQGITTTSKLQLLIKTAKLQHSFSSAVVNHGRVSIAESRQISSFKVTSSRPRMRTVEATLTGATKVLVNSTKSILVPSKTLTVTATTSIVLDYIQRTFLIIFDGICPSSNKQEEFKDFFKRSLTGLTSIERSLIDIHSIKCGSVKVIFSIHYEQTSKIPEILEGMVREGKFQVNMNGNIFKALNITILETTTHPSISTTTDNPSVYAKSDDEKRAIKIVFILFSAVFGALALFGTVICIAKSCGRRQFSKLRLNSSTLSTRGTNQIYKNELELVRLSPLHHGADYYGGHVIQQREYSDDDDKIDNRTALLSRLRNDEIASRRGKIIIKDDDSYSSIAFY